MVAKASMDFTWTSVCTSKYYVRTVGCNPYLDTMMDLVLQYYHTYISTVATAMTSSHRHPLSLGITMKSHQTAFDQIGLSHNDLSPLPL